jgi:predicted nucleotidyltransferase
MFEALISRIARELESAGLPYMIIGGQAVLFHGTVRMTKDIDITLGVDTGSLDLVVQAVKSIGVEIIPEDFSAFVERTYVLPAMEKQSGLRVDFIFSFTPYERQAITRATPAFLGGTKVMFAAVEDVIIHKVFAGRPRDLEDVRSLLIKNPTMDRGYVRDWLKEFAKAPDRVNLLQTFEDIISSITSQNG